VNTMIPLDSCALTDRGLRRRLNEDQFICKPEPGLFVIADGMGGENCGDVASLLTAEFFESSITPYMIDEEATVPFEHENGSDLFLNALKHAADQTNQAVLNVMKEKPACRGMGSTLTAVAVHEKHLYIAHVGDSRLYCFENSKLSQITEDHTRVMELVKKNVLTAEEARTHRERHIITRCVGRKKQFRPDLMKLELLPEALYLICSDGLHDMLEDSEIAQIMMQNQNLEQLGRNLVASANEKGGKDNITIVLFRQQSENNGGDNG
jgi:serine/threonine protein phosphatase PrpC